MYIVQHTFFTVKIEPVLSIFLDTAVTAIYRKTGAKIKEINCNVKPCDRI